MSHPRRSVDRSAAVLRYCLNNCWGTFQSVEIKPCFHMMFFWKWQQSGLDVFNTSQLLWAAVESPQRCFLRKKKSFQFIYRRMVNHVRRAVYLSDISPWLIDPGVYRVVGGAVGGAVSHGPRFWKLKGQTSKRLNDNYHARMFGAFQRRDWVYYRLLGRFCVMSPLSRWSQNFHCRRFIHEEMSHCLWHTWKLLCQDKTLDVLKPWQWFNLLLLLRILL